MVWRKTAPYSPSGGIVVPQAVENVRPKTTPRLGQVFPLRHETLKPFHIPAGGRQAADPFLECF